MEYVFSDNLASLKPSAIREIFKNSAGTIQFSAGNPSPLSFPVEAIKKISADIFENNASAALQYGITEGYTPLREDVEARLKTKFNINTDGNMTIITSGGQQGLELTCRALCNRGDVVVCENPSFIGALNAYRAVGCKTVGVELEGDGMNVEELERVLDTTPNVKLIYVICTFQNPSGITTSLEKRKKIYELALRHGVMILEDNPYGELRFAGEDVPTIKSMDTEGIVVYCSSFSKVFSSGMRAGFICGPAPVVQKMVVAKQTEDVHSNVFAQMLIHRFITEYDFDSHVAKICDLYGRKCALMLGEFDRLVPEIKHTVPSGGLFVWCTLPAGVDTMAFVKECTAAGVSVVPGVAFNCDTEAPSDSFRVTYATPSDEEIVKGVGIIADVFAKFNK